MCGPRDNNEALGMPSGSVRAILSFAIVPTILSAAIAAMILLFVRGEYNSALGILSSLTGISGTVVGYYFGSKSAEKASKEIIRAHDREIASRDALLRHDHIV